MDGPLFPVPWSKMRAMRTNEIKEAGAHCPRSGRRPIAAVLLAVGLVLAGCASSRAVHPVPPQVTYRWLQRSIPVSDEPSAGTLQVLRRHGLGERWRSEPARAVALLDRLDHPTRATRYAALELSFYAMRRVTAASPSAETAVALEVAARSWQLLFQRTPTDPPLGFDRYAPWALMMYDNAVARLVEGLRHAPGELGNAAIRLPMTGRKVKLRLEGEGWSFSLFNDLQAVDRLRIERFQDRFTRYGLGAPLVGFIPRGAPLPGSRLFPPRGLAVPVTAILRFGEPDAKAPTGTMQARLTLVDPRTVERIEVAGTKVPVAADFTAPLAALAGRGEKDIQKLGLKGMFSPGSSEPLEGLILMEPYDPEKVPVVMVHGLWSNPSIWLQLTNEIFGDRELRVRYQVWYFMYPSGEPFLWSAARFRYFLDQVRHTLDPAGRDRATNAMELIGHSMGGLLVKTAAADSGETLWNAVFTVPPRRIRLPPRELAALKNTLFFKPKPYVRRIIFMSTPQHGARLAETLVGKIGSALIHLPRPFSHMLETITTDQADAVTPAMRKILGRGCADAVRALCPDNPVMEAFSKLTIDPTIPFHSIIGNRGDGTNLGASDGVVSWRSAHLDGAASEAIVPCNHHSTECRPAISEVLRILRLPLPPPR